MSHVASVELVINDIASLKKACENIPSLTFMEGQTTHEWYGKFLADSDVGRQTAREFDAETFGKCEQFMTSGVLVVSESLRRVEARDSPRLKPNTVRCERVGICNGKVTGSFVGSWRMVNSKSPV
jgi:hypothetical protein